MKTIQEILDALETNPNKEFKAIYDALQKIHLSNQKKVDDLKTFFIEQIDGEEDDYAKTMQGFLKDINDIGC